MAVFLPKFLEQNTRNGKAVLSPAPPEKRRREAKEAKESKEKRRHRLAKEPEAPARSRRRREGRRRSRSGRGHEKTDSAPAGKTHEQKPIVVLTPAPAAGGDSQQTARSPADHGEPEHWRPGGSSERSSAGSASRSRSRGGVEAAEPAGDEAAGGSSSLADVDGAWVAPPLDDGEREALQQAVKNHMQGFSFLDDEEGGTRAMLSEFVVCMAVTGKSSKEMVSELESFFADHTHQFVGWFVNHVQQQKKKSADGQ